MSDIFDTNEQDDVDLARDVRRRLIAESTKDGKLPGSDEERFFLAGLLKDLDSSAISKARLRISKKEEDGQKYAAIAANILMNTRHGVRPDTMPVPTERSLELPDDAMVEVTEGELEEGVIKQTYDDFMEKRAIEKDS